MKFRMFEVDKRNAIHQNYPSKLKDTVNDASLIHPTKPALGHTLQPHHNPSGIRLPNS